jgi:hopene-associated glycosyltransferase HpnB
LHDSAAAGVLAAVSLVIWMVLLLGRGWFWRVSRLQASAGMRPLERCRVVAIIPARDEADVIAESVGSLLQQDFDGELTVMVVDDNSSDGTGSLVQGATVINGAPLVPGWTGKLWALQQGVAAAPEADFFLFTDADIRHDAQSVASLVGMAQVHQLDLVSHMVKLHCGSWAEKFTIPAFVFFFFKLYPPSWIASPKSKTAGAAGGCVLIRPSMLSRIGGLAAIRGEVIDDCSLARAVKRNGGRLWLGLTASTRSIRPYAGLGEIGRMISRSAFRQLDHSVLLLVGSVLGLLVTYVVPPLLGLSGSYVGLLAWVVMMVCYLPMVRFYGLNPLWSLCLPLTACFYLGATVHSAVSYWIGRGGVWKGRAQDVRRVH